MGADRAISVGMTLVWDVDDVLNSLTEVWFEQEWLPCHPNQPLTQYDDLKENPPHRLLGVPKAEYLASLDHFRATQYHALEPNATIRAWMRRNGPQFRHVALTAAPLATSSQTGEWVYRHWGRWIRTIHVVPSKRANCSAKTWDPSKVDYLRWFGHKDVVLIEDNLATCAEAFAAGFHVLRVPQPWNYEGAKNWDYRFGYYWDLLGKEWA